MLYMDLLGLYWPQTSSSVNIILTGPYQIKSNQKVLFKVGTFYNNTT